MKTLQAGDKAVLDGKVIVTCFNSTWNNETHTAVFSPKGRVIAVENKRLQPVYIVRVLQDGRAREVNPLGDKPSLDLMLNKVASLSDRRDAGLQFQHDFEKWAEAESQCLTLPMCYEFEYPIEGQLWYALLSSDKFTLINPKTD